MSRERVVIDLTEPGNARFIARCRAGSVAQPGRVSTHAARRHVNALLKRGMSKRAIAESAGVSTGYLNHLLTKGVYCSPQKEAALLSVTFRLPDGAEVDAAEMNERLRTLVAAGYDHADLARRLGKRTSHVWQLLQRPLAKCEVRTDRAVRELFDELTATVRPLASDRRTA